MKSIKLVLVFIFTFFIMIEVNASTRVYTRTDNELLVPDDVKVSEENRKDILNTPAVNEKEKIYDFADLYTDSEEKELYKKVSDYIKLSKFDLVIVTTNSLDGYGIENYANNFYDYNNFKTNGVFFIISTDGEISIYMGNCGIKDDKIFDIYTSKRINDILAYVYKDIGSKNYYKGTDNYIRLISGFYKIEASKDYTVDSDGNVVKSIPWIEIIILAITLTFVIMMIFFYKIKSNNRISIKEELDSKLDKSSLRVKLEKDELVDNKK